MKTILTTMIIAMLFSLVPGSSVTAMQPLPIAQPTLEAGEIEFDLVDNEMLWLSSGSQLYISSNSGSTWTDISPNTGLVDPHLVSAFPSAELGFVLLVSQTDNGVELELHLTTNQGVSWSEISTDLEEKLNQGFTRPFSFFQMQWLNDKLGFLMVRETTGSNFSIGKLYKTEDGGKQWQPFEVPVAEEFFFLNENLGFMLNPADAQFPYRTADGGASWSPFSLDIPEDLQANQFTVGLPLPAEDGRVFFPVTIFSEEDSEYQVLIEVDPTLSAKTLLDMNDLKIIPLIIPATIKSPEGSEKTISEVRTQDATNLWVGLSGGSCKDSLSEDGSVIRDCESTWEVLKSIDGGLTWNGVALPGGLDQVTDRFSTQSGPVLTDSDIEAKTPDLLAGEWVQNFKGHAFDKCEIPTLSQLQTWYNSGPYRAVNLYIGGISRFCTNNALTASYIQSIYRQGWKLIPTWVGHQAPCTKFKYPFPYNVNDAYQYGVNNANAASTKMRELNLTNPDGSGNIIYLDLEHFGYTQTCSAAARAYLNGWNTRLTQLGIKTALYSTSSGITANSFFDVGTSFDAVWAAEWYRTPGFRPNETVWNLLYMSNDYWTNYQRIYQYSGGHIENWGGVSIEVDSNVAEGKVSVPYGADLVAPVTKAALAGTIGYDGWYKTPVKVTLTATDNTVGVRHTYYKIGEGTWNLYRGPFLVSTNGSVTVTYLSVDTVDNWEGPKKVTFKTDTTPPVLSNISKVGCRAYNALPQSWCNNAYFVWNPATDSGTGVPSTLAYQYYWGTNPQGTSANYTHGVWFDPGPIPMKTPYYLRLRVQDNNGNWSAWKTLFTLIYDPAVKDILWMAPIFK